MSEMSVRCCENGFFGQTHDCRKQNSIQVGPFKIIEDKNIPEGKFVMIENKMTHKPTAHREFWLPLTTLIVNSDKNRPNGIHVIEYSAVQDLLDALEEIAKDFGTDFCDGNTMIAHEALTKFREGKKNE